MSERFTPRNHENVVEFKDYLSTKTEIGRNALVHCFLQERGDELAAFPAAARNQLNYQKEVYVKGGADSPEVAEALNEFETFEDVYNEVREAVETNDESKLNYFQREHDQREGAKWEKMLQDLHDDASEKPRTRQKNSHLRLVSNENEPPSDDTPPPVA